MKFVNDLSLSFFIGAFAFGLAASAPPALAQDSGQKTETNTEESDGKTPKKSRSKAAPLALSGQYGDMTLEIKGEVGRPLIGKDIEVDINSSGKNLARLAALFGLRMRAMGPYEISTRLKDSRDGLTLLGTRLTIGTTELRGSLRIKDVDDRLSMFGKVEAKRLVLEEVWPHFKTRSTKEQSEDDDERKLFSDEDLPLDDLRNVDLRISLIADTLVLPGIELHDVVATISIKDGVFTLRNASARIGEGKLDLVLEYDANSPKRRPELTLEGTMRQLALGDLLVQLGQPEVISGAPIDGVFEYRSSGSSINELATRLDGQVMLTTGPGTFNNRKMKELGRHPARDLYEAINPYALEEDETAFSCLVFNMPVRNGRADISRLIGLETKYLNILAGGKIDLRKESWDVGAVSEVKSGPMDSVINHLGGTFLWPNNRSGPYDGVKGSLKLGDGSTTKGLSVLRIGIRHQDKAETAPCQTVKTAAAEDNKKQSRAAPSKKSKGAPDPITKMIGDVKGLFK